MSSAAINVAQNIENTRLCFHVNVFNFYHIVDSDVCTSAPESKAILAFPWYQWLGERATY